jgi:hypothetical protein
MPEPYRFASAQARIYPESRDALGQLIGLVEPGGTRELDGPLDADWIPAGDAGDSGGETPGTGQDGEPGAAEGDAPDTPPDGPQPVPPAVVA